MNNARILVAPAVAVGLFWLLSGASHAAPANDDWAQRTTIGTLPYAASVPNVEQATNEPGDPSIFCVAADNPMRGANTIWYEYAAGATDEFVDLAATGYDTLLAVWEGSPIDAMTMVRGGCNDDAVSQGSGARIVGLRLRANTRYSIGVAAYPGSLAPPLTLAFSMSHAAVYAVTKAEDTNDGVCDADCSLREAVAGANATPGAIVVPAGTYALNAALTATVGGAIYGAGLADTVIAANRAGRALLHNAGSSVRPTYALHDLTLADGNALGVDVRQAGGAFYGGGSYYVFDRVALRGSKAREGGGAGFNGAVASIYDSVVAGNEAIGNGGGIAFSGGNLEIRSSAIVDNTAYLGSSGDGGGLYVAGIDAVRIADTTISGNRADDNGGGVYATSLSTRMNLRINNTTIADNAFGGSATSTNGGLVFSDWPRLTAVPAVVTNTIVAGNRSVHDPAVLADCGAPAGFPLTTGYDFVRMPNGCTFAATGDVTGVNAQLLPLTTGVAVPLHVPAPASPVVDAGDPASGCERTDARGVVRPVDGDGDGVARCDIGAVERTATDGGGDAIFANGFE